MAYPRSTFVELARMRQMGTRPAGPVVICDDATMASWAKAHGFFVVDRRDLSSDLQAFSGLDLWIVTRNPIADSAPLSELLIDSGVRSLMISDAKHRAQTQWVLAPPRKAA